MNEEIKYTKEINSNKNHLFTIEISSKDNNLSLSSHFTENYITTNYISKYSLEDLQKKSDYYKQFNDIKMIIKEIEEYKGDKNVIVEENKDKLNIVFPIGSAIFKKLDFILTLKPKSDKEKIEEYEQVFEKYKEEIKKLNETIKDLKDKIELLKNRFLIPGFNTRIINQYSEQNEILKMWISPFKEVSAKLIYFFYCNYKGPINDYENGYTDTENFHKLCDNKPNILVICRSKKEIFGGFTPLSFLNDNSYGYDNDSFVFSLNNLQKYPKNNKKNDKSIWRYANYGPCFCYDLYFEENSINKVKFENYHYTIPNNFIDKKNVIVDNENWILLDSIEIFQINFKN